MRGKPSQALLSAQAAEELLGNRDVTASGTRKRKPKVAYYVPPATSVTFV
jgi:hypothetical protein